MTKRKTQPGISVRAFGAQSFHPDPPPAPALPESWRPESLLQSRAEALSKETGLPLVDAVDAIEAADIAMARILRPPMPVAVLALGAFSLLPKVVAMLDDIRDNSDGRYPSPDPGCRECTADTTPDRLNTGPCAYHAAKALLSKGAR